MTEFLPTFRAKKKDSDGYVEGFLYQDLVCYIPSDGIKSDTYLKAVDADSWYIMDSYSRNTQIDIDTASIHFPFMLDDNKNKMFASLQKSGKGGDILSVFNIEAQELQEGYCIFSSEEKGIKISNGSVEVDYDIFGSILVKGIMS